MTAKEMLKKMEREDLHHHYYHFTPKQMKDFLNQYTKELKDKISINLARKQLMNPLITMNDVHKIINDSESPELDPWSMS